MAQIGIKQLEDELIEILRRALPDIEVSAFGDDVENNNLLSAKNKISVQYTGTSYESPSSVSGVCIQKENKNFDITLINRDLRSAGGIYSLIDRVTETLFGMMLRHGERVIFGGDNFEDYQNEVWIYTIQIQLVTKRI